MPKEHIQPDVEHASTLDLIVDLKPIPIIPYWANNLLRNHNDLIHDTYDLTSNLEQLPQSAMKGTERLSVITSPIGYNTKIPIPDFNL